MDASQSYYAKLTHQSPNPIKRWLHRDRQLRALAYLSPHDKVLDYGAGAGFFLTIARPHVDAIVGYDPHPEFSPCYCDAAALLADHGRTFSAITCFEVCEHLDAPTLSRTFETMRRLAGPGCRFIFSVPIETGLPGGAKHLYRLRSDPAMRAVYAWRALWGATNPRRFDTASGYGYAHTGFSHHDFRRTLVRAGFSCVREDAAPFGGPWWINNTAYFVCTL